MGTQTHRGKTRGGDGRGGAVDGGLRRPGPAHTLVLDFWPQTVRCPSVV